MVAPPVPVPPVSVPPSLVPGSAAAAPSACGLLLDDRWWRRLRTDPDDPRLGHVARGPDRVVEHVAVGVVDDPPHRDRPRRLAVLLDDPRALLERRVEDPLHDRRTDDLERRLLDLDTAVDGRSVQRDGQLARTDERAQPQPVPRVVRELEVGVGEVDGGVTPRRVVRDVEGVIRTLLDRQAGLEGRVEHRRRNLADASAEPGLELAVDDHRRLEKALVCVPLARGLVEGERLAGRDQMVVDELGDEAHVVKPVRVAAVDRRVCADDVDDSHGLRLGRRELGLRRAHHELCVAAVGRRRERGSQQRLPRRVPIECATFLRGHDARVAAGCERKVRVDRLAVEHAREAPEVGGGRLAADRELAGATGGQHEEVGEVPGLEGVRLLAVRELDRARHHHA